MERDFHWSPNSTPSMSFKVWAGIRKPASIYEALRFRSAQRFFIASESRLRPAAVIPPRFFDLATPGTAALALETRVALLLCAQRDFIASDSLRRPAGVRRPPRPGRAVPGEAGGRPTRFFAGALPSRRLMTWAIRSSSLFSSATMV